MEMITLPLVLGYHTKDPNCGIWNRPQDREIEFYLESYTKNNFDGVNRQIHHQRIYEYAKLKNEHLSPEVLYPIGKRSHRIYLSYELDHSTTRKVIAVHIQMEYHAKPVVLGYIPRGLTEFILSGAEERISDAKVYKCREKFHNKFYSTKIILGYDNKYFHDSLSNNRINRFVSIMHEIESSNNQTTKSPYSIWLNEY